MPLGYVHDILEPERAVAVAHRHGLVVRTVRPTGSEAIDAFVGEGLDKKERDKRWREARKRGMRLVEVRVQAYQRAGSVYGFRR